MSDDDESDFFNSENPLARDSPTNAQPAASNSVSASASLRSNVQAELSPHSTGAASQRKASMASLFTPEKVIFENKGADAEDGDELGMSQQIPDLPVNELQPGTLVWPCNAREVRMLGTAIWTADLIPFCGTGVPGTVVRHSLGGATTVVRFEYPADGEPANEAVFGDERPASPLHGNSNSNSSSSMIKENRVQVSLSFPRASLSLSPPLRPPAAKSMNANGGGGGGGGMKFGLDPRGGPSIPKRLNNNMIKQQPTRRLADFDRLATVSCRDDLTVVFSKLEAGDVSAARIVPVPPPAKLAVDSLLHLFEEKDGTAAPQNHGVLWMRKHDHDENNDEEELALLLCSDPQRQPPLPRWVADAPNCDSATVKLRAWRAHLATGNQAAAEKVTHALPERVPAAVRDFVEAVNTGGAVVRSALEASCNTSFSLASHLTYEFGRTLHCDRYLVRGDVVAEHIAGPFAVAVSGGEQLCCANCISSVPSTKQRGTFSSASSPFIPSAQRRSHPFLAAARKRTEIQDEAQQKKRREQEESEDRQLDACRTSDGWIQCPHGTASLFCSPKCARDAWNHCGGSATGDAASVGGGGCDGAGHLTVERGDRDSGRVFRTVFGFLQFQAPHFSDEIRGALLLLVRCFSVVLAQWRRRNNNNNNNSNSKDSSADQRLTTQQLQTAFACLGVFPAPNDVTVEGDLVKFIKVTLLPALQEAMFPETEGHALTAELLIAVFTAIFRFQRLLPVYDTFPDDIDGGSSASSSSAAWSDEEDETKSDLKSDDKNHDEIPAGKNSGDPQHHREAGGRGGEEEDSEDDFFSAAPPPPLLTESAEAGLTRSTIASNAANSASGSSASSASAAAQRLALAATAANSKQDDKAAKGNNNNNNNTKNRSGEARTAKGASQQQQPRRCVAVLSPLLLSAPLTQSNSNNASAENAVVRDEGRDPGNCRLVLLSTGNVLLVVTKKLIPRSAALQTSP